MRRRLDGVEVALSTAVAEVAAMYEAIPEALRPDVCGERWQELESAIDHACGAGDRGGALRAIAAWRAHAERVLAASASAERTEVVR